MGPFEVLFVDCFAEAVVVVGCQASWANWCLSLGAKDTLVLHAEERVVAILMAIVTWLRRLAAQACCVSSQAAQQLHDCAGVHGHKLVKMDHGG